MDVTSEKKGFHIYILYIYNFFFFLKQNNLTGHMKCFTYQWYIFLCLWGKKRKILSVTVWVCSGTSTPSAKLCKAIKQQKEKNISDKLTTLLQHPCSLTATIVYNHTIVCSHQLFLLKGLWLVQSYSDQRRTVQMRDFPGSNTAELQDAWVILLLSETWRFWASQHLKSLGPFKMLPSSQIFLS